MSLKTATVRNLGIIAGLQVFISGMNAITLIVLARLLTPYDFGIIGIAGFFLGFIGQFGDFGLGAAVIHRKDRVEEALQTGATLRVVIGLAIFLVAFFSAPLVSVIFSNPDATNVVRILSVTFIIGSFGFIPNNALAKRLEFGRLAIASLVGVIVATSVSIGLAFLGFSYWAIVYGSVCASVATIFALYFVFPFKMKWKVDKQLAMELFRYGIHVFLMVLIVFLIFNLDNAAVGIVLGTAALGFYFVAYRWANVFANFLTRMVGRVMFPTYSRIQEDKRRLRLGYFQTLEVISFIGAPLYLGFFAVVPDFVIFVLGEKWIPCIVALEILCLFGFIRVILQPAGTLFLATGKTKWLSITNAVNLIVMIVFLYPAIIWGRIEGVALLVFLIYFFHTIVVYWLTTKLLNIRFVDITSRFADPLVASLGMLMVVLVFKTFAGFSVGVFVASILLGVLVYSALIYISSRKKILYYLREIKTMIKQQSGGTS